jgi:PKD repeat protein
MIAPAGDSSVSRVAAALKRGAAVLALTISSVLLVAGPAGATGNTTIGFDDLANETVVTNQYASLGVTFGTAAGFGLSVGNSDCGPPKVAASAGARSAPNLAVAPACSSSGQTKVGTFGAFSFPHKTVSVYVGKQDPASEGTAELIGYDSSGTFVAFQNRTTIGAGAHTLMTMTAPSADIAYFAVQFEGEVEHVPLFLDDLTFDNIAAPLSVTGTPFSAVRGSPFSGVVAHIADGDATAVAGDYTVSSIDWGDGHTSAGTVAAHAGGGFDVSGSHTYGAVGSYAVTVPVTKVNGRSASSAPTTDTVFATALTVTGANFTAVAGSPTSTVVAHIADGDPTTVASDYTSVSIDWGDGHTAAGSVAAHTGGGFDVSGTHTYAAAGSYSVTATVTRAGGRVVTGTVATATVAAPLSAGEGGGTGTGGGLPSPPPPRAYFSSVSTLPGHVLLNAAGSRPPGATVGSYAWNIDGHSGAQPNALCGGEAPQMSTRLQAGTHTVSLVVTAAGGAVTSTTQQVLVAAAARVPLGTTARAHASAAAALTAVFVCSPAPGEHPGDTTEGGGPPAGCATEVQFGLADAVGCLNALATPGELPLAEGKILKQLVGSLSTQNCQFCATASRATAGGYTLTNFEAGLVATQSPFISYQPVRINGIDFYPHPGAAIVLLPDQNMILSSGAAMKLAGVPIKDGLIELYVPQGNGTAGTVHIDDYTLSEQAKRIGIGSLPFDGSIGLDFAFHRSQLPVHVTLPNVFTLDQSGDPIEAAVTLSTDNQHSLRLDAVKVNVPDAFLGPMEIQKLFFEYQREGDSWSGGADIIFPEVSLRASPPPPDQGFGMKEGHFDHVGATLEFDPALDLFPGVGLTHIGFTVGLNPTRFSGSVGLNALEVVDVDGTLLGVFASPSAPYVIPSGAGAGLDPLAGRKLTSTSFAVGGAVSLLTPVGKIPIGGGYLLYQYPDYAEFGGAFFYGFHDIFSIDGHITGFVQVSKKRFDVEAGLHACVAVLGCTGVDGVISSNGIAACWTQSFGLFHIDVGVGYHWGDSLPDIYLLGCDIGPYTARAASVRAHAASSFALPAGLPFATVRVRGALDAPKVTLTGPHGETLVTPDTAGTFADARFALLRQPQSKTTFIGIRHPAAGTWTITTQPGSAPVTDIASASGLPAPAIRARVSGSGSGRTLTYRLTPQPGQQVSFAERGAATWRVIGQATGASGQLHFSPAAGTAGSRQIVALVEHLGLPGRQIPLATFRAGPPPPPSRPSHLTVRRTATSLEIRWGAASNTARYLVSVMLSSGRSVTFLRTAAKRVLLVPHVAPTEAATIRVVGLNTTNHAGRAATLRLARRRALAHARLPRLHV